MVNKIINVSIKDRQTIVDGDPFIICGNSDYVMRFEFDAEWDNYQTRTARFVYTRRNTVKFQDVIFVGNEVQIPALFSVTSVTVGVFAGNLRTTTPARIPCRLSVRCGTGSPDNLTPSQYDRIMELLASLGAGVDITGATAGQVAQIAEVDENGAPTAWQPADLPKVEIPPLKVNLTKDADGEFIASHSASEIIAYAEKGGRVYLTALNLMYMGEYYQNTAKPGGSSYGAAFRYWGINPTGVGENLCYISEDKRLTKVSNAFAVTEMTGATADTDGASGLVPAPAAGDEGKFLRGDGTWGEIDIPEGGGGGGGAKWEKINEITVDEVVDAVGITTDNNGNPFSLRKMFIFLTLPKYDYNGETGTGYPDFTINGAWELVSPSSGWESKSLEWRIEAHGDHAISDFIIHDYAGAYKSFSRKIFWKRGDETFFESIRSIKWGLFGRKVLAGTKLEIYGVRA